MNTTVRHQRDISDSYYFVGESSETEISFEKLWDKEEKISPYSYDNWKQKTFTFEM